MNKKNLIWYLVLSAILVVCIVVMIRAYEPPLKRAQDKEFTSGSQLQIGPISEVQHESLYKLCKVWGYAKYHHPSVVDGTLNWDAELFRVLPAVLQAQTGDAVNETLYNWLNQFPFTVEITEEAQLWQTIQAERDGRDLDTGWIHDADFLGEKLCDYMDALSQTCIAQRSKAYAAFTDQEPYVSFAYENNIPFTEEDDGVKLLALFRFWNIYEYYSPNIEITMADWDAVLKDSIPTILAADNYRDYVLAIAGAAAMTADAHITVNDQEQTLHFYYGRHFLPCSIKVVDGCLVVAQTAEYAPELQNGDIIEAIDGITIADRIAELSRYTPLPEPDKFAAKMGYQLLQTENAQAEVQVVRGAEKLVLQVNTTQDAYLFKNPYNNGLMEQGLIGYIDPSALKKGDLERLMVEFAATKGLIVDLRYYPSVNIQFLLAEYMIPEPRQFAVAAYPNPAIPGSFYYSDSIYSGAGVLKMAGDHTAYPAYHGKVILLMDETTMSNGEFTVMSLRQSPEALVVGSSSIGADGNIVTLTLPGRISLNITGLGVYKPDGTQTQRIGLEPDLECRPTVVGLRDGRDELIEKAAELIMQ